MNELVKIQEHNGDQAVSARELYTYLDLKERFSKWFSRMSEFGFESGADYTPYQMVHPLNGQAVQDFVLSMDCAKEISMLQRNDKGKEARKYFIAVEKKTREAVSFLTSEEQLLRSAQLLVEQKKKLIEHDDRIRELEVKTTIRPDYFTVAGYGNLNGVTVNLTLASRIGRAASKICKDQGIMTDKIADPRFGTVKMYPRVVLKEVFNNTPL